MHIIKVILVVACIRAGSADIFDGLPILSQVKSLVQVIGGDAEGARKTQENFVNRVPVVAQVKSAVHAIMGDMNEARRVQEEFAANAIAGTVVAAGLVANTFTAGYGGNGLINAGNEAAAMLEHSEEVDWEKFAKEGLLAGLIEGIPATVPIAGDVFGRYLRNVYEKEALGQEKLESEGLTNAFLAGIAGFRAESAAGKLFKKGGRLYLLKDSIENAASYSVFDITDRELEKQSSQKNEF